MKSAFWIALTAATKGLNVAAAFAPSSLRQSKSQPSFTKALPSVERSLSLPADFSVSQVDVLYEERIGLTYDDTLERYVPIVKKKVRHGDGLTNGETSKRVRLKNSPPARLISSMQSKLLLSLKVAFVPEGVTDSYYTYIKWRVIQRFINANVHVLGTQSLLLGLGLKNKGLGVSAALNWVLKDTFGKMVRLLWASKMGRKFDSDAKRWRFRSSLLYALGNAFEIITYMFPSLFLLLATSANALKQISMLTSSSTRTSIYNSFRTRENIGDIVAKGEAQISVVDLLGILSGVCLSRIIRMNIKGVVAVYVTMQVVEIFCIYKMIGSVEYKVLNFERLMQLLQNFVASQTTGRPVAIPTPQEMARTEMIFLPPQHLARRTIAFGSLGRAKLAPDELATLLEIFNNERFMLVVGADEKNASRHRWRTPKSDLIILQENCHIVLHADATNVDIVKSTLALSLLRQSMAQKDPKYPWRSRDCMSDIQRACQDADQWFPLLLRSMSVQGWAPPARFMFGRVTMRAEWPLQPRAKMSFQISSMDIQATVNSTNIASSQ
jgi:hypothetical protein